MKLPEPCPVKLLGLLCLSGLCGAALGLLRLAAEQSAPRARCPVCAAPVADPLEEYCHLHEGLYRAAAQETRVA